MTDRRIPLNTTAPAKQEAEKAFKTTIDAGQLLSEHQLREKAFFENRARLKAERLAREAAAKE